MSALVFTHAGNKGMGFPCGTPGCNRSARWQCLIAGWVSGTVCQHCKNTLIHEWAAAHDVEEVAA